MSTSLHNWIKKLGDSLRGTNSRRARRQRTTPARRPAAELLEDRITPSNFLVTDLSDTPGSAGDVTLRYAVTQAQNGDTITFSTAGTVLLTSPLTINTNVSIIGQGSANTTIDGGGTDVFDIGSGLYPNISNLTVQHGNIVLQGYGTINLAGDVNIANTSNVNLGPLGDLTDSGSTNDIVSGVISGSAAPGTTIPGLIGTYFNLPNTTASIQPANPSNSSWIGNQIPAVTAQLVGPLDFYSLDPNWISNNGFQDTLGNTYYNLGAGNNNNVEARWIGDITVPGSGTTPVPVDFRTASDDGSMLYIDGVAVVNNNFYQGVTYRTGVANLVPGVHFIDVEFYNGGGGAAMVAQWDPTGTGNYADIDTSSLSLPVNGVIKTGTGTLTLANTNTYTGSTTVEFGTVLASATGALGASSAGGIYVNAGGAVALSGNLSYTTAQSIYLAGAGPAGNGALESVSGSNSFTTTGNIFLNGTGTVGADAGTLSVSPVNLGASNLTTVGAGAVDVAFSSNPVSGTVTADATGGTTISGNVVCQGSGITVAGTGDLVFTGGIDLGPTGDFTDTSSGHVTVTGAITGEAGSGFVQGLVGTYFNLPAATNLIQPAASSNPNWLGNQVPAATAQLVGPVDFYYGDGNWIQNNGFTDNLGNSYYNLGAGSNNNVEARWSGEIIVPGSGATPTPINFATASDDGSMLYIDGNAVVNNNVFQGVVERTGLVDLTPGLHNIDIEYYNGGGGAAMVAGWDTTGGTNFVDIPNTSFATLYNAVIQNGTGTLTLQSNSNSYAGPTLANAGTVQVTGTVGDVIVGGGVLAGTGTTGAVTDNSGAIKPGIGGTSILHTGDLSFAGGSLSVALNGTTAGTSYDQLSVTGNINLTNGILTATLGYTPSLGDSYTIIHNVNNTPITGVLSQEINNVITPLPQGAGISIGGDIFQISYTGGAGHDVTLTRADAPAYEESLDASGNLSITQNVAGDSDNLTFSLSGGIYTITDTGGLRFDLPTGAGAGSISGGGTSTITIPSADVNSISVILGPATNTFTITGTDAAAAPLNLNTGGFSGDQIDITGASSFGGDVTLTTGSVSSSAGATLTLAGNLTMDTTSAGTLLGGITDSASGTIEISNSQDVTLGGPINAPGDSLSKDGDGLLIISSAGNLLGATTINGGTLEVTADGALGTATAGGITVNAGTALAFGGDVTYATAEPVSIVGTGPAGNGAIENISGTNSFAGSVTLEGPATIGSDAGTLTIVAGTTTTIIGNLTTTGAGNLDIEGLVQDGTQAPMSYVGFTGATGGLNATQSILNWTYTSGATTIDDSAGFTGSNITLNGTGGPAPGTATINGSGQLVLTDGNNNEAHTAWNPTPVPVGSFTTTFQWTYAGTATSPPADGFTFAVQSTSNSVVGGGGSSLGYGGIGNSYAVQFNTYTGSGSGSGSDFGVGLNGVINHSIDLSPSGISFINNPNDVYQATITNNGAGLLTVTVLDTNSGDTFTSTFTVPSYGGVIKNGSGTLTLSGADNTFTGATTINAGTLVVTADGAMGPVTAGGVFVNPGGALAFTGGLNYTTQEPTNISGSGPAGNGAIENISGSNSYSAPIFLTGSATIGSDAGTLTLPGSIDLVVSNLTFTGAGQTAVSGVISSAAGTAGLRGTYFNIPAATNLIQPAGSSNASWIGNQVPAASALLTGTIDFPNIADTGFDPYYNLGENNNNNVEARWNGDIMIPGTGTTPVPINFATSSDDGSMLYIDGVAVVNNNAFQGVTQHTGLVNLTPGLHTIDIEYYNGGGGAAMRAQWDPTGGSTFVDIPVSAFVAVDGGVTKTGSGMVILSHANTYTGATTINGGTLVVTADAAMGPASADGVVVNNGGALALSGGVNYATAEPITIAGTGPGGNGAIENISGSNTLAGAITLSADATIGSDAGALTLSGNIDLGSHNLTSTGAGQTTMSGVISFGGGFDGVVGDYFNLPASQNLIQPATPSNSAWLGNQTPAATAPLVGPLNFYYGDGNWISNNGFEDNLGNTYYNPGGGNNNVEGRWSGEIMIAGSGTDPVPINFATTSDDGSMLYIDGNAVVNNNFFQGPTQRTGLVNLTPGLHAIDVEFYNGGGGAAMEAQWDPTGGTNFVDIPNFASGGGSVIKTGTGTTILSGDNTYTGTTLVNGGTLQVDGSIATSFGVTVASGATLSGTGTVSATTVNGTLQPGDPGQAGTLNTDLSFGAGSTLKINENNSVCSEVNVTGTASLTGASLSLTFADVVTVGSTYTIVHTTGGLGGTTFNGLPDGSTLNDTSGQTFQVNYTATDVILTKVTSTGTAPTVTGVVINQDIAALYNAAGQPFAGAQRSMVNDVVYTFSEPVNIVSSGTDPNVFTIAVASGFTGTPPTLNWAPVTGSGNTQWAVSFSGSSVSGGSIANGAYDITINVPSEITAVSDSLPLTVTPGTAPAPGNPGYATQEFYRLYGDINGDKFVNAADNSKFKLALATYNQAFDYNGDGFVNAFDNGKFKNELTVNFSGFTPTI